MCSDCGHVFIIEAREIEEVAGELQEITEVQKKAMRKQRGLEMWQATTVEQLISLGMDKGYASPEKWAGAIMAGRRAKEQRIMQAKRKQAATN